MKGVIIAAGLGTRLKPTSKVVDKNLFLIYDKPMIYYSIMALKEMGVTNILLITNPKYGSAMLSLLGGGRELGVNLTYDIQEEQKGIAHALSLAEDFADNGKIAVFLPDNIFEDIKGLKKSVAEFKKQKKGARVAIATVKDPRRFGVVKFDKKEEKIKEIVEKPSNPPSNWAVVGFYLFDGRVFDFIRRMKPSARGEYEVTDLCNFYVNEKTLSYHKITGTWIDAGTFDSLLEANNFMAKQSQNNT